MKIDDIVFQDMDIEDERQRMQERRLEATQGASSSGSLESGLADRKPFESAYTGKPLSTTEAPL